MLPVIRVLLADDNACFRMFVECLLSCLPWIEIVGQAQSGLEAVELEARLRPDLVVTDWEMPGLDGLEATRRIKARANAPRVIVLTGHDEPEYSTAACGAGADGFINKSECSARLLPVVRQVCAEPSAACT